MIHENINNLIPFISENFITFPLWEEGKYIPFINFWIIPKNEDEAKIIEEEIKTISNNSGYIIESEYKISKCIVNYLQISPSFTETEDGGYEFNNNQWSIEEMLTILQNILNKIKNQNEKI